MHSFNPNPRNKSVGDCPVRALCAALGMDWKQTYSSLCMEGYAMCDMPNSNAVWGAYLRRRGFTKHSLPDSCLDGYTVADFAADHPQGVYVLALPDHVMCVRDGEPWDSWDSSNEVVLYYFQKEE